ncbi:MAG: hypothetical protein M1815_005224 [Lichina confinis]|nr:MAG: hypothetical protein M1815_005224 [Lichina confinis]
MGRSTIDWNTKESYQRLLAATQAAAPQNHNYRQIATFFGQGATYDAIEGRFRKIKADAAELIEEVESGERPEAPARGTNGTPRKARARAATPTSSPAKGVRAGRVTKNGGTAKGRKKATGKVASSVDDATATPDLTGSNGIDGTAGDEEWDKVDADVSDEFKAEQIEFIDELVDEEHDDYTLNVLDWED